MNFNNSITKLCEYLSTIGFEDGTNPDKMKAWLASLGFTGTINDAFHAYLRSLGYSGTINDMFKAWGTSILDVLLEFSDITAIEFSDGAAIAFKG